MAFTAAKDSGRTMFMEYSPLTPPLTPKKAQLLKSSLSWQSPLIESTRNPIEERQIGNEEFNSMTNQCKYKENPPADSIVPKKYPAYPITIRVPPRHVISSPDFDPNMMEDDEEPIRTFKLQDPPKGKIKYVSRKCIDRDESDSGFKLTQPASPSRAKCQTSITQYFPTSQQSPSVQSKTRVITSPNRRCKIARSPCTPSKRARCTDSPEDGNLFVFPAVPRNTPGRVLTSPLASPSPNWKKYRKRSIEGHSYNETEVAEDFLDLSMSSPTPVQHDSILYGHRRSSEGAIDVSPRLEKNIDYRNMKYVHDHSQTDYSVSSRYERQSCEEPPPCKNRLVHKHCNSSQIFHQNISPSGHGIRYTESVSVDHDPNFGPYSTTPVISEEVVGESYFDAVSRFQMDTPKSSPGIIHGKMYQEHSQQNRRYPLAHPFKHSVSDLVKSEIHHEPGCGIPDSFPYVCAFKSAYDEHGIYRRDEACCDKSPGKIQRRRVSNKDAIREREYLHDENYWIYKKNCIKDCTAAASHTLSPHSEEISISPPRTPTSPRNIQMFPQSSRITTHHPSASATHVPRSPAPMKLKSPTLNPCFSPSTKLQQCHLSNSPMTEKYSESSRNSTVFLEHYAPSGSSMNTFVNRSQHCSMPYANVSNIPWSPTGLNPSFHSGCQYRTSPSSPKWLSGEQHGISSPMPRRRLFCKSEASEEPIGNAKEEETAQLLHSITYVNQNPQLSYGSADSMITMGRNLNRFTPSVCDEVRKPCECYERARSNRSYVRCMCACREALGHDNSYSI